MTDQEKESLFELQNIDCNCSDCYFMIRDAEKRRRSLDWHESIDLAEFEQKKAKAIADASALPFGPDRTGMLNKAHKMKFQFDKSQVIIHYGDCLKFSKAVSFIPGICQVETQACFVHRKDITFTSRSGAVGSSLGS